MNAQAAVPETMPRLNQQMMQTMILQDARTLGFMGTNGQLPMRLRRIQGPSRLAAPSRLRSRMPQVPR